MVPYARTFDEVHLFMQVRPCDCGDAEFRKERTSSLVGGARVVRYRGACVACERQREFAFRMASRRPATGGRITYGLPGERSQLLDAAEWLTASDFMAGTADLMLAEAEDPAGDHLIAIHGLLSAAVAAAEESAKFLPPGAAAVPDKAFWSEAGRSVRTLTPDRFERSQLAQEIAMRRQALDAFEQHFSVG